MEIKHLDPTVVDQIAAGEVIERPAQMAKELIENSLDAGAKLIQIEVESGGRVFLIEDDGKGMVEEDLKLSVARHATSKISTADDLFKLSSFGFRGEALASISSISELEITSRHISQEAAYSLKTKYGEKPRVLESSRTVGTSIRIENLFENVPARKKFLKSDSAEVTAIKNIIKAMAMVRPDVEFKLKANGRLALHFPVVDTFHQRVEHVLEVQPMYHTQFEFEGFHAEIVYAAPNNTLRVNRGMWFFVQDRYVQDRRLQAAVMEAYRGLLMHGEYPYCVARIHCPLDEVDVNIHPTKSQVKFAHQDRAFRVVNRGLRFSMEKAPWIERLKSDERNDRDKVKDTDIENSSLDEQPFNLESPRGVEDETNLNFKSHEFQRTQYPTKTYPPAMPKLNEPSTSFKSDQVNSMGESACEEMKQDISNEDASKGYWSGLQVIGQSHLTYLLCQSNSKLIIVDQHAAHERVMYERLMNHWNKGGLSVQQFLVPLSFEFSADLVEVLMSNKEGLERLGVLVDQAGPEVINVEGLPEGVKEKAIKEVLEFFARDVLENGDSFAIEKTVAHICATMACHSAIRAGQALSHSEIGELLRQMDEFPLSSFCPHGRPVYIEYPVSRLEKDFGRSL